MQAGLFISVEGAEGVGKTTSLAYIHQLLDDSAISYTSTREPGGTQLGEKIRDILLDKKNTQMTDMTELLLMFAARAQHVEEVIKPALNLGSWVICDRFTDSSFAYQGAARGIAAKTIDLINEASLDSFSPDLTVLLDVDVKVGMQRAGSRGELDRFEKEDLIFFEKVRQGFLARAKVHERFNIIDASKSITDVNSQLSDVLLPKIHTWLKLSSQSIQK